jgi:hypothetical protein
MFENADHSHRRLTAILFFLAGLFFILFPLFRPFFDESTLQGAVEFSSARWVIAHVFGMFGFILLSIGFLGVYVVLHKSKAEPLAFLSLILCWTGTGLTLPFFGAEAFGLYVIGDTAVNQQSTVILDMVNSVRSGPGLLFILVGLLIIAVATIVLAIAVWKAGMLPMWGGVPLAVGFVVYIPQLQGAPFFQPIRIVIGIIIFTGCILMARGIFRSKPV